MKDMNLSKLANGALQDKFSQAFAKVLENLTDPNTPFKDKRSINLQLTFTQNESRNDVKCQIAVKTKLAPVQPVVTSFGVFKDLKEGTVSAEEYGSQLRGQTFGEQTNDKDIILKFAGTVETGTVANYGDDGVSQKATIQQTVTSKEDVIVPNPVHLIPYRTFLEVEQPCSNFVFRIRDTGREPEIALFEADGGAWKIDAMKSINEYLTNAITDLNMEQNVTFTVIS